MKTLLGINGETYLLPDAKDLAKVLEVLKGIQPVRSKTVYGPDGEHRYSEEHGYCTKEVLDPNPARIKVEVVLDGEIVTREEYERLLEKASPNKPILPETVG
jgi:hypothetical protein